MRNKRLLLIFGIFVVVVLAAVIGSAVFSLQNIEVVFKDEFDEFVSIDLNAYGGLDLDNTKRDFNGKSILVLDRKELAKTVESDNLWLSVLSTETSFHNSLKITAIVRTPVFHFKAGEVFYTCDYQGFVMTAEKLPNTIEVVSSELSSLQVQVGAYLNCDAVRITCQVIEALWRQGDEVRKFSDIPHYMETIVFTQEQPLRLKTVYGAEFIINEPSKEMLEKFTAVHGLFLTLPDRQHDGVFRTGYTKSADGQGWQASVESGE